MPSTDIFGVSVVTKPMERPMVRPVPKTSILHVAAYVVVAAIAFGGSCKAAEEGAAAAPASEAASGSASSLRGAIDAGIRRAHTPAAIARDARRLLSEVVDLDRRPAPGDRLRLLYASTLRRSGAPAPRLLAAEFDAGGVAAKFFLYRGAYYDQRGESTQRALLRKPIVGGEMQSPFGWMRHPILGYAALHGGTAWWAPLGTPVRAAARGTVETPGPERHGGLSVLVRHSGGYETYYKHLSSLASGLGPGDVVSRGQIIGVVGSADLFYQIILDHRPIDPELAPLPPRVRLRAAALDRFKRQQGRLERKLDRTATPIDLTSRSARIGG